MKKSPRTVSEFQEVLLLRAKENPLFPDWLTERLRFLRYRHAEPCAHCQKRRRRHWTLLLSFEISEPVGFVATTAGSPVYRPLTAVCTDHLLAPHLPTAKAKARAKK